MNQAVLPTTEEPVTLDAARELVPGRPRSRQTLWRWCVHGLAGVQLEHLRVGGEILTSAPALRRFFERVTAATSCARRRRERDGAPGPERARAIERAHRELGEAGF